MKVPSGLMETAPLSGSSTGVVLTTKLSPSGSVSFGKSEPVTGISSSVVIGSSTAIGGSFTAPTKIVTVAVSQATGFPSSQTSYSKLSVPLKPLSGV